MAVLFCSALESDVINGCSECWRGGNAHVGAMSNVITAVSSTSLRVHLRVCQYRSPLFLKAYALPVEVCIPKRLICDT